MKKWTGFSVLFISFLFLVPFYVQGFEPPSDVSDMTLLPDETGEVYGDRGLPGELVHSLNMATGVAIKGEGEPLFAGLVLGPVIPPHGRPPRMFSGGPGRWPGRDAGGPNRAGELQRRKFQERLPFDGKEKFFPQPTFLFQVGEEEYLARLRPESKAGEYKLDVFIKPGKEGPAGDVSEKKAEDLKISGNIKLVSEEAGRLQTFRGKFSIMDGKSGKHMEYSLFLSKFQFFPPDFPGNERPMEPGDTVENRSE